LDSFKWWMHLWSILLFEKKALATLFVKEFIDRILFFYFHVMA